MTYVISDIHGEYKKFITLLEKINLTRERLITPLIHFKKAVKNANALTICSEIYNTIIAFKADERIKEYALELNNSNRSAAALEQGDVWNTVMEILGGLPEILGDDCIKLKDFAQIFSMVISTEDLGTLPVGIDNVQIGQADRIRTDNPRAVFVLGANEGEFPLTVSGGGLLSESDRRIMLENDLTDDVVEKSRMMLIPGA